MRFLYRTGTFELKPLDCSAQPFTEVDGRGPSELPLGPTRYLGIAASGLPQLRPRAERNNDRLPVISIMRSANSRTLISYGFPI